MASEEGGEGHGSPYRNAEDEQVAAWQGENDIQGLSDQVRELLDPNRHGGGWLDARGPDKRLVVYVKALTDEDRRVVEQQVGDRYSLLRLEDVRYSWDELVAVQAQLRHLAEGHPGGASMWASSIRSPLNQVVMTADGSSPEFEALAASTVPPGSLLIERGRLEFVME